MGNMSERSTFATTHWSLVVAAGQRTTVESERALAELCEHYWYPLYAFVRRRGHSVEEARDLTQEFFAFLLEKDRLQLADQQRGRFRSFLLTALDNFLTNQWRAGQAQKRGGGRSVLSLDWSSGEQRYLAEPADFMTPERIFDRRWALTLLERVLTQLREQYRSNGKETLFLRLQGCLSGEGSRTPYAELAREMGMSEAAIKVAVHRLRQRCGELLREEIAQTVADQADIDEELGYLFAALAAS